MFRLHLSVAAALVGLLDLLLLACAGHFGAILRALQVGVDPGPFTGRITPVAVFMLINFLGLVARGALAPESFHSGRIAAVRVLGGLSLGALALAFVHLAFPPAALWPIGSLYAMTIAFGLLFGGRTLIRLLADRPLFRQHVLILGAGPRAKRVADIATQRSGLVVVGHIDLGGEESRVTGALGVSAGTTLSDYVLRFQADEVVLALEERRKTLPMSDLIRLRTTGVRIVDASTFIERETGRIDLRSTNPSWLIFSEGFVSGRRISAFFKRSFDIVASLALLVLVWPVILMGAVATLLDSRGPVLFRQTRVGLYGAPFSLLKLRSMRTDAESDGRARWAEVNDHRITRVGKWLRVFRIDELPQLWNVLRGEMSFVGPRPERPEFVSKLEEKIVYYAERHMVKPGITGWAQINYPYGASLEDGRAKLEYDLFYAKNYTIFLDILIILQTVRVVLWPEGVR